MTLNHLAMYLCILIEDHCLGKVLKPQQNDKNMNVLVKKKCQRLLKNCAKVFQVRQSCDKEEKIKKLIIILFFNIKGEFANYLNFCRSLRFDDRPDYQYLRQLFRNLFHRQGFTYDYIFDWNMLKLVISLSLFSLSLFIINWIPLFLEWSKNKFNAKCI